MNAEEIIKARKQNRRRRYPFDLSYLAGILRWANESVGSQIQVRHTSLPEDAWLESVEYDVRANCLQAVYLHPTFDEVTLGAAIRRWPADGACCDNETEPFMRSDKADDWTLRTALRALQVYSQVYDRPVNGDGTPACRDPSDIMAELHRMVGHPTGTTSESAERIAREWCQSQGVSWNVCVDTQPVSAIALLEEGNANIPHGRVR